MVSITQPKQNIMSLWRNQGIDKNESYRLMRYVLQDNYKGEMLLHNVVTGELVILNTDERELLDQLPAKYDPIMDSLIRAGILVNENFDESSRVIGLRSVLRKIEGTKRKAITDYTILLTTACNARCFYCYEKGIKASHMTLETAYKVVDFISSKCKGQKIWIEWFGGEPTLSIHVIDEICRALCEKNIEYSSKLTTNGYLLDKEIVSKAKDLWHLKYVMISVDGTERNYNRIKSFVNPTENPYHRVLRNVGYLLDKEIYVSLRMNFNSDNYRDFAGLVSDVSLLYAHNPYLRLYPHHIDQASVKDESNHEVENWYREKIFELNCISRKAGLNRDKIKLPHLNYRWCQAANDASAVITPEGNIVSCAEQLNDDQIIGNITEGKTNSNQINSWKREVYYQKCLRCKLFPSCIKVSNCNIEDKCYYIVENRYQYLNTMRYYADQYFEQNFEQ